MFLISRPHGTTLPCNALFRVLCCAACGSHFCSPRANAPVEGIATPSVSIASRVLFVGFSIYALPLEHTRHESDVECLLRASATGRCRICAKASLMQVGTSLAMVLPRLRFLWLPVRRRGMRHVNKRRTKKQPFADGKRSAKIMRKECEKNPICGGH